MATEVESVRVDEVKVGGLVDSEMDTKMNGDISTENEIGQKENGEIDLEQTSVKAPPTSDADVGKEVNLESNAMPSTNIVEGNVDKTELSVGDTTKRRFCTTIRDTEVEIRISEGDRKPQTVIELFEETCSKYPNHDALKQERDGKWVSWSYAEYQTDVKIAAKAFIKLGLEPFNSVGIIGFNAPEWNIADIGAVYACGLGCGIYTTNSPEACHFVASDARVNIVVAENDVQVQKFYQIWDRLPHLKAIIQYKGELVNKKDNVYTWDEFMEIGRNSDDNELKERMQRQKVSNCCTLIYTSGTTGNPKGVMLSHDNVTYSAWNLVRNVDCYIDKTVNQCIISYLPLSHIAAQILDVYGPMVLHGCVWFARPDALKGSLGATLKAVRPTIFFGVPRVFEKIEERLKTIGQSITGVRRKMANWAKGVALKAHVKKEQGQSAPFGYTIAGMLLKKIRVELGFDRCSLIYTGAAPISLETLRYFQSINLPLLELYGMSEGTGVATLSYPRSCKSSAVGKVILGADVKIFNQDEDGSGEICMRGRFVFMGYLENEAKTKEAIDDEGWLHSGDVGRFDENGFLYITGRIKELIITAGGENIAPVPIEERIKAELPFVSNTMVIGDKKKFLSVLLTPKVVIDPDSGEPADELTPQAIACLKEYGLEVTKASELSPKVPDALDEAIKAGLAKANSYAVSNAAKVQKYYLLASDFSIPGGELGPTLKLRRPQVHKKYANEIDGLYAS